MNWLLIPLLVLAMIATVVMLVRGVIAFLQTTQADLNSDAAGPSASGLKQNQMMIGRVGFQALAIVIVVLIVSIARN